MQRSVRFPLLRALGVTLLFSAASQLELHAQAATETPAPAKTSTADELAQAELLKSYLHVREQLHTAELAIANNRLEAEATARAQAAAIAEKLESIRTVISTERDRQQAESQRAAAERERERVAARDSNRIMLWVAAAFGVVGLLTMLATTLLQWRGIKRMTEVTAQQRPLPVALNAPSWLPVGNSSPATEAITVSNQRLMSVIDRMERRILELEHTTAHPFPIPSSTDAAAEPTSATSARATLSTAEKELAAKISALLGKGRSLLNSNKASEAVTCFDEILALDANHPEALVKKGSALERLKQDLEAIECYDRAIKADRNMALAYLSKGGVFNRLQRFDEAVECYEQALQVDKHTKTGVVTRVTVSGDWPTSGSSVPA